jgi:Xaa-Pro dipeptidase
MSKYIPPTLIAAEEKASFLFQLIENKSLIRSGKSEKELNEEIFKLAKEELGIEKYWHKRIVRAGENTLLPYDENPSNLTIQQEDIVFLDFGPIFEEWEADFGRTFVVGKNPLYEKLRDDSEKIWHTTRDWIIQCSNLKCSDIFHFVVELSEKCGWTFGGEIAGHLIGHFPHERLDSGQIGLYIHPENHLIWPSIDAQGQERNWILEVHIVDKNLQRGSFFEQLVF